MLIHHISPPLFVYYLSVILSTVLSLPTCTTHASSLLALCSLLCITMLDISLSSKVPSPNFLNLCIKCRRDPCSTRYKRNLATGSNRVSQGSISYQTRICFGCSRGISSILKSFACSGRERRRQDLLFHRIVEIVSSMSSVAYGKPTDY